MSSKNVAKKTTELTVSSEILARKLKIKHDKLVIQVKGNAKLLRKFGPLKTKKKEYRGTIFTAYQFNKNQLLCVLFKMNNPNLTDIKAEAVQATSLISIIEALDDFDFDNLPVRFVYAVQDKAGNLKIGISNDPKRRIKELNIGNPDALKLVFTRQAVLDKYQDEVALHKACEPFKIRSEWFTSDAKKMLN
ncbi:MAG: hypothetical protein DRQ98_12810 [Gammaproteobacteria bacterium]|nr:MAG: hypothetical protein DRQ98_12810 [Gammaproteobacteria bacterium]